MSALFAMWVAMWVAAIAFMLLTGKAVKANDAPKAALFGALFGISLVLLAIGQSI